MRRRNLLKSNDRGSAEGHNWIEIGGVKWATTNIGAEKETDPGIYFQWGDTAGYTSGQCGSNTAYKKPFADSDYKFNGGRSSFDASGMTKYNSSDGKTVLEPSDDAATLYWGGDWRMPTKEDFDALTASTTSAWTDSYNESGTKGLILTDKINSEKKIFFPAYGFCYNGLLRNSDVAGFYYSSSVSTTARKNAYRFAFTSIEMIIIANLQRRCGFNIRPVLNL